MPLNWNITEVRNWKEIARGDEFFITDALILATLVVRMGSITKRNWQDFFERLDAAQREDYPLMKCGDQNFYFTKEQVERRIGLRTNMTTVQRSEWDWQRRQRILKRALAEASLRKERSFQPSEAQQ